MRAIDWPQALAWRMRRQLLDPIGTESVAGVVRRLGAVQAQSASGSELAIRARRRDSRAGEGATALAKGEIIKTFAFRGATNLMTPEDAGAFLALRAAGRQWELPSWQSYYQLKPADWPGFREAVGAALAGGPLTVDELGKAITAQSRYRHLDVAFPGKPWTLLKALAWQGVLSLAPTGEGRAAVQRLDGNPRWAGIADLDDAGPRAIEAYFRAYGPATPRHVQYWLGEGLSAGRKRIEGWLASFGDRLASVEVGSESALVLREDLDELVATPASTAVRLLPAYDPWVLGPGTSDPHVVPPARRALVSKGENLVISGGRVSGTWAVKKDRISIDWFEEADSLPAEALDAEVARLAGVLDRPFEATVQRSA